MCGIIGYIGPKDVVPVLIDGLRKLEYRGYDSAGVAVVSHVARTSAQRRQVIEPGRVIHLDPSPAIRGLRRRPYALGDARASHRGNAPSAPRLHRQDRGGAQRHHRKLPRSEQELSEGHCSSRNRHGDRGASRRTRDEDDGLENALRRSLLLMRGLFALVLISADDPEKIVAAKTARRLSSVGGRISSSRRTSRRYPQPHPRRRLPWRREGCHYPTGVSFTDFFGRPVSKATQRVLWDPIMAEKAGFKHFMLKEIFEQPTAVRETILGRVSQDSGKVFLEPMKITDAELNAIERVTLLACGTSWHAALVGKFLIEHLARLPFESTTLQTIPEPARGPRTLSSSLHSPKTSDTGRVREPNEWGPHMLSATSSAACRRAKPTGRSSHPAPR